MKLLDYTSQTNRTEGEILHIIINLLDRFEDAPFVPDPNGLTVNGEGNLVFGSNAPSGDRVRLYESLQKPYCALADLLLQILSGTDVLRSMDRASLLWELQHGRTLLVAEDVSSLRWFTDNSGKWRRALIQLSSNDREESANALVKIRNLMNQIPCLYECKFYSPDRQQVLIETIALQRAQGEVFLPLNEIVTLPDNKKYRFIRSKVIPYPGEHKMEFTADSVVEDSLPEPDLKPERKPQPKSQSKPQPKPEAKPNIPPKPMRDVVVGIDLGTTKTCVVEKDGQFITIEDEDFSIPSVLFYETALETKIGKTAENRGRAHPRSCVSAFKRQIGSPNFIRGLQDVSGNPVRSTGSDAAATYMIHIFRIMEEKGLRVRKAVITVPADFNAVQRAATLAVAQRVGLPADAVRLLEEPTAAAIYYDCHRIPGITAVYDFGGGTFDFCILESDGQTSHVLGKGGDGRLGGEDLTDRLLQLVCQKAENDGVDLPDRLQIGRDNGITQFYASLRKQAETAKCTLSFQQQVSINTTFHETNLTLDVTVTRDEFETVLVSSLHRIREIVEDTLARGGITAKQVDRVVIVGGSTCIPAVDQQIRQELFPECRDFLVSNRIFSVAMGAEKFANSEGSSGENPGMKNPDKTLRKILPTNCTVSDLGIRDSMGRFVSVIPAGINYSNAGCSGTAQFVFHEDSGPYLEIKLYTREGGTGAYAPALFECNNPVKMIGKLRFDHLPNTGMKQNTLTVCLNIDTDGVLHAEANIMGSQGIIVSRRADIESY